MLAILLSVLFAAAPPLSPDPRIVILGYHEVEPGGVPPHATVPRGTAAANTTDEMQRYTASTEAFSQQLDALARHGYTVIAMADVADFLSGKRPTLAWWITVVLCLGFAVALLWGLFKAQQDQPIIEA